MRLFSLIAASVIAVSSLVTVAQAQMNMFPPDHPNHQRRHQRPAPPAGAPPVVHAPRPPAPQLGINVPRHAAPPVFHAPRHVAPPPVHHQPRVHHAPRFNHAPRIMPFPMIIPQTQYIDRPVYIPQEPTYYVQPRQRYYDDEPTYRPRRAQRCRTVVARDRWGARHYVKKCRPVGRRYR